MTNHSGLKGPSRVTPSRLSRCKELNTSSYAHSQSFRKLGARVYLGKETQLFHSCCDGAHYEFYTPVLLGGLLGNSLE